MTFGEYIRKHRVDRNMTLRMVAQATGLSSSRISSIERHCEPVLIDEVKDAIRRGYQIEDADTFYTMAAYYKPDEARIARDKEIMDALAAGTSDAEMAAKYGVFVNRKRDEDGEV